jgi:hypothetical protein
MRPIPNFGDTTISLGENFLSAKNASVFSMGNPFVELDDPRPKAPNLSIQRS